MSDVKQIQYISTGQAADILHVSAQTVRDWTANGKLNAKISAGGHRSYDDYEVRLLALRERGINSYWSDDVIIQLRGDGTITVLGQDLQPMVEPAPYEMPLRESPYRQRSPLVASGQPVVIRPNVVETVTEKGELLAETYLAVLAFTREEAVALMKQHLPTAIAWLRANAIPRQGVAAWLDPTGKAYASAY